MYVDIDHSLTPNEILQFPFVSPYGMRHYQRGDWLNQTIGVIELFPILGPIVSLIEGIVVNIFHNIEQNSRLRQTGWFNKSLGVIEVIPLIGPFISRIDSLIQRKTSIKPSSDLPVQDIEKWMSQFKANVQNKKPVPAAPVDLSLTKEQELELAEIIKDFETHQKSDKATLLIVNLDWIFTINNVPGRIFKVPTIRKYKDVENTIEKRLRCTLNAKKLIQQEGYDLLHVPEQKMIQVKVKEELVPVLIEESLDLLQGTYHQAGLFQRCYNDPDLKPFIRECTRQLILFIIKTGFSDVKYDNIPLLTNGKGIGLIDLDKTERPVCGLIRGGAEGADGILQYLSVEEIEHFEPLLRKELSQELFDDLNLETLKKRIKQRESEEPAFKNYLKGRNVSTTREPVDLTGWNPYVDERKISLENRINEIASQRLGFHPPTDRRFYIKDFFYPEFLDELKSDGRIFNWQDFKEVNHESAGYYFWA